MENIDFENDWKMISIQIGSNDQCQSCVHPDVYSADNYERYVDAAIQRIRANIPKVIVNIIDQFVLYELYKVILKNNRCIGPGAVPKYYHCPCAQEKDSMNKMKVLGKGRFALLVALYFNLTFMQNIIAG